jgi:hypothetical protein
VLARAAGVLPNLHVLNPACGPRTACASSARRCGSARPRRAEVPRLLTDFSLIRDFVPWVHETHAAHLAYLRANVRPGDVVVTHHLPHPKSTPRMFVDSPLNRFFVAGDAGEVLDGAGARCGCTVTRTRRATTSWGRRAWCATRAATRTRSGSRP